ncbi:MAG: NTP transferase domain-containing protein [Clostridiaceae bacterium]|jgi:mannose-1-phosphate guanylyltransferase/phosphomannomutase|nr:NTP transferase domain-containing protein [Clostridiaceae bacterium]
MKAVIMAGGEGTRLRPLTCNRPKPMVPIVNKPVMEHIIELLKKYNITDIAVTLQYLPDLIKEYFGDGSEYGVNLKYYVEDTPMGTAGSVKNAEEFLDDTFIVISGDALTDINLSKAIDYHMKKQSMATLVLKKVDIPLEYGVVVTNEDGRIIRFLEKPSWGEVFSDTVNTGIYILSPEVLKFFNKNEVFDFSKDLFPMILKDNKPMYGFVTDEYWCDIGDLRAYWQANMDVLDQKVEVQIPGNMIREKVWIGDGTTIEDGVAIQGPCLIGANTKIKSNAMLDSYCIIGDNTLISESSSVKKSVIWKGCVIDKNVEIRGTVICNKVNMKEHSSSFENSVIGCDTIIKENAIIKPNIKIWPNKMVEEATEVNSNLVWGTKSIRSIFGQRGLAGEINVDITPEYASKLGAAYGATLKGKGTVGVSCEESSAAKMLKISFISGLLSAGLKVIDLGILHLPVSRSAIRFYGVDGGIHISTSSINSGRLHVDFLDTKGSNIDRAMERKIENAFAREDFSRCEGDVIKELEVVPDFTSFYLRNIINNAKNKSFEYKIALNSPSKAILKTVSGLLKSFGCSVEETNLNLDLLRGKGSSESNELNYFTSMVKMGDFDFGISIEDNSERMMLVDNKGRIINEDMFTALVSLILFKTIEGGTVVVPLSTTHVVEKLAKENHGKVIRTKTSHQDVMNKILGNEMKSESIDQFNFHFDAISALIKIMDFLKSNNYKLVDLINMIPDFYVDEKEVECSWNAKGKVMRRIIQESDNNSIETLEGVKIFKDGGWVLILPDSEQPVCRIKSESYSAEIAQELTSVYADKVAQISRS